MRIIRYLINWFCVRYDHHHWKEPLQSDKQEKSQPGGSQEVKWKIYDQIILNKFFTFSLGCWFRFHLPGHHNPKIKCLKGWSCVPILQHTGKETHLPHEEIPQWIPHQCRGNFSCKAERLSPFNQAAKVQRSSGPRRFQKVWNKEKESFSAKVEEDES